MAGTMVQFPSNGGTTSGYLATPQSGKGPGGLLIQEGGGPGGHIKKVCDRFAAEGFSAPAPGPDPVKKAGKTSEIHIYQGVDHGFFNDERPDVYNKTAADDAGRRTLAFFRRHLK